MAMYTTTITVEGNGENINVDSKVVSIVCPTSIPVVAKACKSLQNSLIETSKLLDPRATSHKVTVLSDDGQDLVIISSSHALHEFIKRNATMIVNRFQIAHADAICRSITKEDYNENK